MVLTWTDEEKANLTRAEVSIHGENITPDKLDNKTLPTDIHVIEYEMEGVTYYDAVRAYKMVNIFDVYHDKLKGGGKVVRITNGYGSIRPNLWTTSKEEKSDE